MIQKKTIIFIILTIFLAVGVSLASNYAGKRSSDEQPSNPTDSTAGWQTYQNDQFRYRIKYPKDWIVVKQISKGPSSLLQFIDSNEKTFQLRVMVNQGGISTQKWWGEYSSQKKIAYIENEPRFFGATKFLKFFENPNKYHYVFLIDKYLCHSISTMQEQISEDVLSTVVFLSNSN